MYKYAIIVAGGSGVRMGNSIPKQFLLLQGKPVLWHTLKAFTTTFTDIEIILVLPENHLQQGEMLVKEFQAHKINITAGGETRFQSVKNGLEFIKQESIVFVHDGVRCLVTPQLITQCFDAALQYQSAVAAITATDTIRLQTATGNQQVDRTTVRVIQTPQVFFSEIIINAFKQDYSSSFTDEASVVEKTGVKINLVPGEETNIKITKPVDLAIAEQILEERKQG